MRRIVCAYDLGALPTWWLQVHRWIKTRLEREAPQVKVDLTPLRSVPADTDLVVVPPELFDAASTSAPDAECVYITPTDYPAQVTKLLARLRAEGRFETEPTGAAEELPSPKIVKYVGYERVD